MRLLLVLSCLLVGCAEAPRPSSTSRGRPVVHAVNYPLAYFASRIGGDLISVQLLAPPDVDPAFWRPEDDDVLAMQEADLILINGAGYARWLEAAILPRTRMADTSVAFRERFVARESETTHTHGPSGRHAAGDPASTTWLDLSLAVLQARAILNELTRRWPEHRGEFESRFAALERDLEELDESMDELVTEAPLFCSHPVYQYWARRYGADTRSLHWEPDQAPGEDDWSELEALLREHQAQCMIWEQEPLADTQEMLEDLGIRCVVLDPCAGSPPAGADFMTVMRRNQANLAAGLPR